MINIFTIFSQNKNTDGIVFMKVSEDVRYFTEKGFHIDTKTSRYKERFQFL